MLALASLLLVLPSPAVAQADDPDCPPTGSLIFGAPRPAPGNLVVCTDRLLRGLAQERKGHSCIYVCDGLVTGIVRQRAPAEEAAGTDLLDAAGLWVVPGFVDLRGAAGVTGAANEESSEVTPALEALDFVDAADPAFEQARRAGVTSVLVLPGGRAAIGGLAGLVKTDERPLAERLVVSRVALSMTLGYEPTLGNRATRWSPPRNFYYRRPSNRMGLAAEIERALFAARHGLLEDPSVEAPLRAAMDGIIPTFIRARSEGDVRTALRLAADFGLRPVLLEGTEAWRHREALATARVPVVLGPLYQQPRGGLEAWEGRDPRSAVASLLDEAGVTVAFASGPEDPPGSLREWALLSVRHGLDPATALRAITSTPGEVLGIPDLVGRIAIGNAADLVVLDGDPMDPTARVLITIIDGRVAWRHPDAPELTSVPVKAASLARPGVAR